VVLGLAATAHAADASWPDRPINFILPSGPGGVTDTMARHFAQAVSEELKQPVVVLNRPGASGTIALQAALNASADGYTFVVGYPSNMIAPRYQFKKLGFDADNDFIPISELAINEMVVIGNAGLPGRNFKEYLADTQKQSKANASFGSYGEGSYAHLIGNYINAQFQLSANHVAYKTEPQMLMAIAANEVPWGVSALASAKPLAEGGKIKILGILSSKRSAFAPEIPTLKEQGFEDPVLAFTGFSGLFAKKGTSPDIIRKMEAAIMKAGKNPDFQNKFISAGIPLRATDAATLQKTYNQQIEYYRILSERAGIEKK
jgi:tripartite-type tricarboxylate transporter receptor subunit TctC